MSVVAIIITFIISLFIMITIHELGHFILSKRNGVIVEEFGICFPPRIVSITRGDTKYSFNAIPLGAFVKTAGENDPEVEGGLASKSPWVRMKVFAAGPLANILLAFVILTGFFLIENEMRWVEGEGVMVQVMEDKPAESVGVEFGDVITQVDETEINSLGSGRSGDLYGALDEDEEEAKTFVVQRNGEILEFTVQPEYDSEDKRWLVGIVPWWGFVTEVDEGSPAEEVVKPGDAVIAVDGEIVYSDESFADALASVEAGDEVDVILYQDEEQVDASFTLGPEDTAETVGIHYEWVGEAHIEKEVYQFWEAPIRATDFFVGLPAMMVEAISFIKDDPSLGLVGPVGAGQLAVETTQMGGFSVFLFLAALVSLGLALFNLIPMPPLDGGGMLVALIEGIRGGKRLSPRAIQIAYTVGIAIVISLFVIIMYSDIARLIRGESFFE
jgi:regulator of sigma E protease